MSGGYSLGNAWKEEAGSSELHEVLDLEPLTREPKHQRVVQRLLRAGVAEQAQAGFAGRG